MMNRGNSKYGNILDHIGHTPLTPIMRINPNKNVRILAKLEQSNPGGSIKDRPALFMIEAAENNGSLTKPMTVLEATSGNTGIGLSMVCALKGYRLLLAMSESTSAERRQRLEAFGARLKLTPAQKGSDGAIEWAYKQAQTRPDQYFLVDQYNNDNNWKVHYLTTAPEIWEETNGEVTDVVISLGTGGTAMGIAKRLKELAPHIRIIGVEPPPGHRIQGLKNMKESYVPGIFDKGQLDECISVSDAEAFGLVRRLALEEGLFVGMSSGAALAGALRISRNLSNGMVVVIFPDGGDRYLSTGVFDRAQSHRDSGKLCLYNKLTRQSEVFCPEKPNHVSMYTCGPTADGKLDLAQGRRFAVADLLKRHLNAKNFKVTHIVNITDLDDRIIQGAMEKGLSPEAFAAPHIESMHEELKRLRIQPASHYPRTTDHIGDMIELTQGLLAKGIAYEKNHSIYFDISRYQDYARFSGINLEKIKPGLTVDLDNYDKNNPRDFALFKRATLKEVKLGICFETPWGLCRPGWHIQCACMSLNHLGENFDIHTSDSHLVFPHNENEIAIAGAATGKSLARYWFICSPVLAKGKAMLSQSNRVTLHRLFDHGYTGRQVRFFLLRTRYRKPLEYDSKNFEDSCRALNRLDRFVRRIRFARPSPKGRPVKNLIANFQNQFNTALDDDLNISLAMAALFRFLKIMNVYVDHHKLSAIGMEQLNIVLQQINGVLGILDLEEQPLENHVKNLIQQRNQARKQGDWQQADDLRAGLYRCGVVVHDSPTGAVWQRVQEKISIE